MNHTAQNCPRGKSWVVRRRACASSVNANCGASTERLNAGSSRSARDARSSPAPAPKGRAITVSLLETRLTSAPSAQANPGVKNSSRPKRKSKVQTSHWSRSSQIQIGCWVPNGLDPSPRDGYPPSSRPLRSDELICRPAGPMVLHAKV